MAVKSASGTKALTKLVSTTIALVNFAFHKSAFTNETPVRSAESKPTLRSLARPKSAAERGPLPQRMARVNVESSRLALANFAPWNWQDVKSAESVFFEKLTPVK